MYKVTGCLTCPFMAEDVDFDYVGNDTLRYCNLLRKVGKSSTIESYSQWNEAYKFKYATKVLDNCPLKDGEIKVNLLKSTKGE